MLPAGLPPMTSRPPPMLAGLGLCHAPVCARGSAFAPSAAGDGAKSATGAAQLRRSPTTRKRTLGNDEEDCTVSATVWYRYLVRACVPVCTHFLILKRF